MDWKTRIKSKIKPLIKPLLPGCRALRSVPVVSTVEPAVATVAEPIVETVDPAVQAAGPYSHIRFNLPVRTLDDLFPGIRAMPIQMAAAQIQQRDTWPLPVLELLNLGAICQHLQPRRIFEIGTYRGAGTLTLALNTPPDTEIWTLDLPPPDRATHQHGQGVGIPEFPIGELFTSTPSAAKIHQLYGDSQRFDPGPWAGTMDLVVVDADHIYDYVRSDSQLALKLLRPGGLVLWDDYLWLPQAPECGGVTRYLDELGQSLPCVQLAETRLALYCERFTNCPMPPP
jgi:predicted O-methyltransferase YrrM